MVAHCRDELAKKNFQSEKRWGYHCPDASSRLWDLWRLGQVAEYRWLPWKMPCGSMYASSEEVEVVMVCHELSATMEWGGGGGGGGWWWRCRKQSEVDRLIGLDKMSIMNGGEVRAKWSELNVLRIRALFDQKGFWAFCVTLSLFFLRSMLKCLEYWMVWVACVEDNRIKYLALHVSG